MMIFTRRLSISMAVLTLATVGLIGLPALAAGPTTYALGNTQTAASIPQNSAVTTTYTTGTGGGSSAPCGTDTLIGGGSWLVSANTTALKLNGTVPVDASGKEYTHTPGTSSFTGPIPGWGTIGGAGGQTVTVTSNIQVYPMCLSSAAGIAGADLTVVANSVSGPAAGSFTTSTAACPLDINGDQEIVVGGGARTLPDKAGGVKPYGTYPSDSSGNPVTGTTDAFAWTALANSGPTLTVTDTTTAYAVCAPPGFIHTTVVGASKPIPSSGSGEARVTVTCPSPDTLLAGGVLVHSTTKPPPSGFVGTHITADYPIKAPATNPSVTPGVATTVDSWAGVLKNGGQTVNGSIGDVYALCAT
jgi:hypothetical protein